jgi:regulatory protein
VAPRTSARTAAITLLARRDYTSRELRAKLRDRGHPPEAIDETVAALQAEGALDDRRVASAHARTATRIKNRGRLRVTRELEARGIPAGIIQDVVSALPASDEVATIRRILARKRWPDQPSLADRRRMYQHLVRRGFPADSIRRALGARGWEPDDPSED